MARLHEVGQDVSHLSLLRGNVALQMAVERQEQEAMGSHHPRDKVHHQQLHLSRAYNKFKISWIKRLTIYPWKETIPLSIGRENSKVPQTQP